MYRVSKILNNNGVIAINTEDNQEYVLLGKGIGFGKKVSQRFEVTEDTATYRLTEQTDRGSAISPLLFRESGIRSRSAIH